MQTTVKQKPTFLLVDGKNSNIAANYKKVSNHITKQNPNYTVTSKIICIYLPYLYLPKPYSILRNIISGVLQQELQAISQFSLQTTPQSLLQTIAQPIIHTKLSRSFLQTIPQSSLPAIPQSVFRARGVDDQSVGGVCGLRVESEAAVIVAVEGGGEVGGGARRLVEGAVQ